jgi:hypothetical protein
MRDDKEEMRIAIERFKKSMKESVDNVPSLTRKGRTLYIVNNEARELRRIDRIFEER